MDLRDTPRSFSASDVEGCQTTWRGGKTVEWIVYGRFLIGLGNILRCLFFGFVTAIVIACHNSRLRIKEVVALKRLAVYEKAVSVICIKRECFWQLDFLLEAIKDRIRTEKVDARILDMCVQSLGWVLSRIVEVEKSDSCSVGILLYMHFEPCNSKKFVETAFTFRGKLEEIKQSKDWSVTCPKIDELKTSLADLEMVVRNECSRLDGMYNQIRERICLDRCFGKLFK